MLELITICKHYGSLKALQDIELRLGPGIYALLDPNGAGKTSLLNIIVGALRPDSGEIRYQGQSLARDRRAFSKNLGFLPQFPVFYKDFSANEFLTYMCILKDLPAQTHAEEIERVLDEVNLSSVASKRIGGFSGGMRQRLGIAQAMLGSPDVLIFDEPTAGLDPIERIRFRNSLSRLSGEKTILIATHIVPDIESIAHTVILISRGQIIAEESPDHLIQNLGAKVWSLTLSAERFDSINERFKISNIQLNQDLYTIRLVADNPPEGAVPAQARLEEAYIYYTEMLNVGTDPI